MRMVVCDYYQADRDSIAAECRHSYSSELGAALAAVELAMAYTPNLRLGPVVSLPHRLRV